MADKSAIQKTLAEMGLTISADFVPWSRSRNAGEKYPSLNWRVSLLKGGKAVLAEPIAYSAGMGHAPSYKPGRLCVDDAEVVKHECEKGKRRFGPPILPNECDVWYSIISDASAIDARSFEEWASEYGYDPDSRKAETIYSACLKVGLALRAAIGDAGLAKLRASLTD